MSFACRFSIAFALWLFGATVFNLIIGEGDTATMYFALGWIILRMKEE